jgi:hypothetical protein
MPWLGGHHVVLALGAGDYERPGAISLARLSRRAARAALDEAGVPFDRADNLAALARRSFASLLREMSTARGGASPAWATLDHLLVAVPGPPPTEQGQSCQQRPFVSCAASTSTRR